MAESQVVWRSVSERRPKSAQRWRGSSSAGSSRKGSGSTGSGDSSKSSQGKFKDDRSKSSGDRSQFADSFNLSDSSLDSQLRQRLLEERVRLENEAWAVDLKQKLAKLEVANNQRGQELESAKQRIEELQTANSELVAKQSHSGKSEALVGALRAENELLRHSQAEWRKRFEKLEAERDSWDRQAVEKKYSLEIAKLSRQITSLTGAAAQSESLASLLESDKQFLEKQLTARDEQLEHLSARLSELQRRNSLLEEQAASGGTVVHSAGDRKELVLLFETLKLNTGESLALITKDLERLHFETEQQRLDTTARLEQTIEELRERNRRLELANENSAADMHLFQLQSEKQYFELASKFRTKSDECERLLLKVEELEGRSAELQILKGKLQEKFTIVCNEFKRLQEDLSLRITEIAQLDSRTFANPLEDWKALLLDFRRYLGSWGTLPLSAVAKPNEMHIVSGVSTTPMETASPGNRQMVRELQERLEKALRDKKRIISVARAILDSRKDYRRLLQILRQLIVNYPNSRGPMQMFSSTKTVSSPPKDSTKTSTSQRAPFKPPGITYQHVKPVVA